MKTLILNFLCIAVCSTVYPQQKTYRQSIAVYQQNYVATHEVVKADDKKGFRFFQVNSTFCTTANFEKLSDSLTERMKTSGAIQKDFSRYGYLYFTIDGKALKLTLYQSIQLKSNPEYADYLFLPFTDLTSGEESYAGGRYIDLRLGDIVNNKVSLDFNKAYNPYCAYTTGYNCPIPPRENYLDIKVKAGEMNFAGQEH